MKLSNAAAGVLDEHHKLLARTIPTPFSQRMIAKWGFVVVPEKDPFAFQVILETNVRFDDFVRTGKFAEQSQSPINPLNGARNATPASDFFSCELNGSPAQIIANTTAKTIFLGDISRLPPKAY
jgi:hypothetical protein